MPQQLLSASLSSMMPHPSTLTAFIPLRLPPSPACLNPPLYARRPPSPPIIDHSQAAVIARVLPDLYRATVTAVRALHPPPSVLCVADLGECV